MRVSELRVVVRPGETPDRPEVDLLVDGADPFEAVAEEWRGFDPDDILGSDSPLIPVAPAARIAVRLCSCGIAGCGVIAPLIAVTDGGGIVEWSDFNDYTGVFNTPVATVEPAPDDATPWNLPPLRFNRAQYVEEIQRAAADRSWETPRRATARLIRSDLVRRGLSVPGAHLDWVAPREDRGYEFSFTTNASSWRDFRQILLRLESVHPKPSDAARDIVRQLADVPPDAWAERFRAE